MMITSTTRKLTRFQYAATLLGALAVVALAPATAPRHRQRAPAQSGCHYTDADGYHIPIDDGQDVFVDGKIVPAAVERPPSPLRRCAVAAPCGRRW